MLNIKKRSVIFLAVVLVILFVKPLSAVNVGRGSYTENLPGGGGVAYFGGHTADIILQNSNMYSAVDARADKISDWAADITMADGHNHIKTTLVKGSP